MDQILRLTDDLLGLNTEPPDLSTLQMAARSVIVFVSTLVMLRVAHKRFFAQRNALDVLLILVLASTLSRAINGSAAFFPTIAIGFVLVLVHRTVAWLASRSAWIGQLIKGSPALLIEHGRIKRDALRKHALSEHDLEEDLRLKGVESAQAVRTATLERNGEVSVVKMG